MTLPSPSTFSDRGVQAIVAIWQFIIAFFCLIGIAFIATFALPSALGHYDPVIIRADVGAIFTLSISIFVLLSFIGSSVFGGIGVLMGKAWGRIVSIVNASLSLFFFPIGTVIGVLVLVYLTRSDVREYFEGGQ